LIQQWDPQIQTMVDVWNAVLKDFSNAPCFGIRKQLEDKKWGEFTFNTYADVK